MEAYYIPTNFTDAGKVMGLFALRNLIETLLLVLPTTYLCVVALPLSLTPKIIVSMCLIIPLGGFGLMGIRDESLGRWFGHWWRWRRNRRLLFFRCGAVK